MKSILAVAIGLCALPALASAAPFKHFPAGRAGAHFEVMGMARKAR